MPKVVICSSVSFYPELPAIKKELESLGLEVVIPSMALDMEKELGTVPLTELKDEQREELHDAEKATPEVKRSFITAYFKEIEKGDLVLAYNPTKHGMSGYIGANVLMELTIGFYLGKRLFMWTEPSKELGCFDELEAMGVRSLNGQAKNILK